MEQEKKQKSFGARMGEASFCIIYLIYFCGCRYAVEQI